MAINFSERNYIDFCFLIKFTKIFISILRKSALTKTLIFLDPKNFILRKVFILIFMQSIGEIFAFLFHLKSSGGWCQDIFSQLFCTINFKLKIKKIPPEPNHSLMYENLKVLIKYNVPLYLVKNISANSF